MSERGEIDAGVDDGPGVDVVGSDVDVPGAAAREAGPDRPTAPGWLVWLLIILATVIASAAILNTWLERQVLETDEWVAVTDELLEDEDIREALSTYLAAELFRTVDVKDSLESILPEQVSGLAGPISTSIQGNAVNVVDRLLGTSAAQDAWRELNVRAQTAFVRVVRDDNRDSVSTANGALTIDLRTLLTNVADSLGLPGNVIDRIPEDAGQVVIFESDQLDAIQQVVAVVDVMSTWLFILVMVLFVVAVYLALDRRVAVRNVGWSLAIASTIILLVRRAGVRVATEQLAEAQNAKDAARAVVTIATKLLNELSWAGLSIGLLLVAWALLVGPSAGATWIRRVAAPVLTSAVGIAVAAVVFLILWTTYAPGFSFQRWLPVLIFAALFVAAVVTLHRVAVGEADERAASASPANTIAE